MLVNPESLSLSGSVRLPTAPCILRAPSLVYGRKPKQSKIGCLRARFEYDNDPLLQAAVEAASRRFQETHRPEPLFVDPYAGCFVHHVMQMNLNKYSHHYCLATKFIDDKVLRVLNHINGLKQVVLLTNGMDTRPYRLNWPTSTLIFDVSPERIFKTSAEKLAGVGAKIPKRCVFLHIPLESSNIEESLRKKGFSGNQPSIWVIQGLPIRTLANFEEILFLVSSLAMNGCLLVGELPAWLAETEFGVKASTREWLEKLFLGNGFRVDMINYNEVAMGLGKELAAVDYKNLLFVAEQLRFSDDQMDTWRREFQRVEEEGDEEGFEEL